MSTYMVNECPVDLPLDNPTAGDLKKHLGCLENSSVVVMWPNGRAQVLQDHENLPEHATPISIIPPDKGKGGGPPDAEFPATDIATIVASIAALTQVFLMIADMWSRRTKEDKGSKKKQIPDRRRNEVEHIAVWMSDGNRVEFDSWHHEPERVRDFINVFGNPFASAKPKKVVVYLKARSKIEVDASDIKALNDLLQFLHSLEQ